jgi:hypothetical protein
MAIPVTGTVSYGEEFRGLSRLLMLVSIQETPLIRTPRTFLGRVAMVIKWRLARHLLYVCT